MLVIRRLFGTGTNCIAPSGLPLLLCLFPGLAPWAFLSRPCGASFAPETSYASDPSYGPHRREPPMNTDGPNDIRVHLCSSVVSNSDHFAPRIHAARVCHSGSSCEDQCLPPGWKATPPASAASGIVSSQLASGSPGTTNRSVASKLRRDSSSFHDVLPGASGWRRNGVPCEWHTKQRARPLRLFRKMGSTRVLKNSKSSAAVPPAGGGVCCADEASSGPATNMAVATTSIARGVCASFACGTRYRARRGV